MTLHELDLRIRLLDNEIEARQRQIDRKTHSMNELMDERRKLVRAKEAGEVANAG